MNLSEDQWSVLALLAQGYTNKEIAGKIGRTKNVVDKMLSNGPSHYAIYPKIGVTNAKGAVAWYLQRRTQVTAPAASPATPSRAAEPAAMAPQGEPHPLYLTILGTLYICLLLLLFVRVWLHPGRDSQDNIWANAFLILPALVGFYGLHRISPKSTDLTTLNHRAWRFFSAGLVFWASGALISSWYSLRTGGTAPYPSAADLGFFPQTVLQTLAFGLWWWESYRRGAQRPWLLPLLAALFVLLYLALEYTVYNPLADLAARPLQLLLDGFYALGDSSSLAIAICLVTPMALRHWDNPMRRVVRTLAAGMALMYLSGLAFMVTSYLPEGHPLKFSNGNPIDFTFATAFLLMGIAIGLIPDGSRDDARQPAAFIT